MSPMRKRSTKRLWRDVPYVRIPLPLFSRLIKRLNVKELNEYLIAFEQEVKEDFKHLKSEL